MYRALFAADLHSANMLPYAQRDPKTMVTDRLFDVLSVLDTMGEYADANYIKDIWIVGDLLDRRLLDAVTLKLTTERLLKLAKNHTIRLIPGNHEAHDAACLHYTLDVYSSMGIWVAGQPGQQELYLDDGPRVLAIPYMSEARVTELLQRDLEIRPGNNTLLLLHQTIKGGRVGEWVCPDGLRLDLLQQYRQVLSGHFHTPQQLADNVMYLGAPLQHHFNDAGDVRGFWDVKFGSGGVKSTMIETKQPRFHELEWDGVDEHAPNWDADGVAATDYVHIKVRVLPGPLLKQALEQAEFIASGMRTQGARQAKVTPVPVAQVARERLSSNGQKMSMGQMVSRYLDVCDISQYSRASLESVGQALLAEADV